MTTERPDRTHRFARYMADFDEKTDRLRRKSAEVTAASLRTFAGGVTEAATRFWTNTPHASLLVALSDNEREDLANRVSELYGYLDGLASRLCRPVEPEPTSADTRRRILENGRTA